MSKYYDKILEETNLKHSAGSALVISTEFKELSSVVIARCTFIQQLLQSIIYTSHGRELVGAKKTLREFPSPKARVDFLCSFPYSEHDPVVSKVFEFSRGLFGQIYELRNILSHELWSSSESHPGSVLFSTLDENARLLMASGRLWHKDDATSKEIYEATIRFIRGIKVISSKHLKSAVRDADLCGFCLLHINTILKEADAGRREEARRAFFVYKGTSHLFDGSTASSDPVKFSASAKKTITW
jgi:hypothetical protein